MTALVRTAGTASVAKPVEIVGVACGRGARDQRCREGPEAVRRRGPDRRLHASGVPARWRAFLRDEPSERVGALAAVADVCLALALETQAAVERGSRIAVVGGDHSIAVGTWSGAARALGRTGPLGLVWIDAHMDSHVPETSPSGALHGMPLAALLGFGACELTSLAGNDPLLPDHVSVVGVRSYEAEEAALLASLGVRVHFMEEVCRRGLDAVVEDAVATAADGTAGFAVSLDLDAVDPDDAPGVGTPEPGGIDAAELVDAFARIGAEPGLIGVEIAELNPARDRNDKTARLVCELLGAALSPGGEHERNH